MILLAILFTCFSVYLELEVPTYISKITDLLGSQETNFPNHSYLSQLDVTYNPPDLMSHFLPPHEVSFTFCCSSIVFPR
ncbi:putative glutamine transport system permease protein [Streptococcus pneumoniae]|nr:putative glutamine transport system permease protein [Streptococcus pneumoniae]